MPLQVCCVPLESLNVISKWPPGRTSSAAFNTMPSGSEPNHFMISNGSVHALQASSTGALSFVLMDIISLSFAFILRFNYDGLTDILLPYCVCKFHGFRCY